MAGCSTIESGAIRVDTNGNSVDSRAETVFTTDMTPDVFLTALAFEAVEGEPTNSNTFTSNHRRQAGDAAMRRAMVLADGDPLVAIRIFNEAMESAQAYARGSD